MNILDEISRRRTFGIISHPDAGKTTLTEKLLLFGGAIRTAGAIKSKKADRYATSDFMEIEKQRGISVATSVMGFEYGGRKINILDTPGHADFCEDTYRTLTAVDSALMVIDCVKGVEEQTYKLLDVCRMRTTPVMTLINKCDREGRDPISLLDEIEDRLSINVSPVSWPLGIGKTFKGVYHLIDQRLVIFKPHTTATQDVIQINGLSDPKLKEIAGSDYSTFCEEVEMVQGVYPAFNKDAYLNGRVTPVFFGSALNNFGVQELLDFFVEQAPAPQDRIANNQSVSASQSDFSGFIFKIHANIDPKHRNRLAFLRVCSGKFVRNTWFYHVRTGKKIKFSSPTAFMAQDKSVIEEAYPGDIIGLPDSGVFQIGDTITAGTKMKYEGIPSFSPEIFRVVRNMDPLKTKQLKKGLEQLTEEGVAQLFSREGDVRQIVGTVGALQFDVIQYRLANEYGASCQFEPLPYTMACWLSAEDPNILNAYIKKRHRFIGYDKYKAPVYFAETQWSLEREISEYKDITFSKSTEKI